MKLPSLSAALLTVSLLCSPPELPARTWTSADGSRTFEGELRSFDAKTGMVEVIINGKPVRFHRDKISGKDRQFLAGEQERSEKPQPADWDEILSSTLRDEKLPAIGGIVIRDGRLSQPEVHGLRKFDGRREVTPEDKWHIGSCTKAMTATLVATFVEEGKTTWDTTIADLLGDDMKIREDYRGVTFRTLVKNRSGIPGKVPDDIWASAWRSNNERNVVKARAAFVEAMLNTPPSFPPGTDYEYSNSGFITAGAMLEVLSGKSWEELMEERIFAPLKMTSAGFGPAASEGKEDQPWGHSGLTEPVPPGPSADNPRILGPAGTVHVSLLDLARFVRMHLLRETGPVLKNAASYDELHRIGDGNRDYASGWIVVNRNWAGGEALSHAGSNTMNYCLIWMAPQRRFASIVVTNVSTPDIGAICDGVIAKSIERFLD